MTRRTISRIWVRAQEICGNPDIHQFALCQPARPPEKEDVSTTQEMERTMMEFAKLVHISPLFKRRTIIRKLGHALGMRESCFGIVCHDGKGMGTTMACEVDNDVDLPY